MIILGLVISVVILVIGILGCVLHDSEGPFFGITMFGTVAMIVCVISLCFGVTELANTRAYDAEIAVIQEQNKELEQKINECVVIYLEHEGKTYDDLTPDKALAYATALPQLASNMIIQEQIITYKENRKILQDYLLKKARLPALRYKVYFGEEKE